MTGKCGTTAGYRAHKVAGEDTCRPCRDAQAAWQREYEVRRYLNRGKLLVDSTGTRRRLQALVRIGWSFGEIGERLGAAQTTVHRYSTREQVFAHTAEKIRAIYDELSMIPGPSSRARFDAARKGWPPPLAYDDDRIDDPKYRPSRMTRLDPSFDEIAVERACSGDRVHLRPVERKEAVRRLTAAGMSATEIARRLDVTDRSVNRHRSSAA